MSYTIVEERLQEGFDEVLLPLLERHWDEVAKNKELMVLKPDVEKYLHLARTGSLITLFAYDEYAEIVGYSAVIIQNHIHYVDLVVGYNDVIFIDKEHRGTSLGIDLINATEKAAKDKGARLMLWHAKENTALNYILPKMGNKVQEIIYSKEL